MPNWDGITMAELADALDEAGIAVYDEDGVFNGLAENVDWTPYLPKLVELINDRIR